MILAACALGPAAGRDAAASATYMLTDLGTSGVILEPPGDLSYSAPQVDSSGAVHFGARRALAGAYSFVTTDGGYRTPGGNSVVAEYSKSGSSPVLIWPTPDFGRVAGSLAGGINAAGTAVGTFTPNDAGLANVHTAFLYNPANGPSKDPSSQAGLSITPGVYPGTVAWYALGVNASGMIVGVTGPSVSPAHVRGDFIFGRAMLSDGKTTTDLNTLISPGSGFLLTSATSINDLGQIAGYADDASDGRIHAYLLTPTAAPEPGAWAVALGSIGLAGLRRLANRRKTDRGCCNRARSL